MQSDVFDKKIQEAAAHHHPVYDEQAWDKMQLKLDKHLPVEKKDRRRFLWLWIFLLFLAAGGSYFFISQSSGNKNIMVSNDRPAQLPSTAEKAGEANNTGNNNRSTPENALPSSANSNNEAANSTTLPEPISKTVSSKENKDNSPSILSKKEDNKANNASGFKINKAVTAKPALRKDQATGNTIPNTISTASTQSTSKRKSKRSADAVKYTNDDYSLLLTGSKKKKKDRSNKARNKSNDEIATNTKTNTETIKSQPDPSPIAADDDEKSMTVSLTGDEKKAEDPVIVNEKEKTDAVADNKTKTTTAAENKDAVTKAETAQVKIPASKKKNKFGNNFAFTISAGPDVSAIQLSNVGKTEFEIGVGLSYSFAKRWNVRSGFFVVDKVYSARPQDYNPPPQFWNYYPYLEDIYANCRVFEIPLIVSYTIKQNVNHAWFASAGLSSLSMNRERYDYVSKTSAGGYETRRYTIHNINSHFFSALRLSAGYYKQINKGTFFVVEPYISAPLKGVGLGKVKLSGAGVLFTLGIRPFQKK